MIDVAAVLRRLIQALLEAERLGGPDGIVRRLADLRARRELILQRLHSRLIGLDVPQRLVGHHAQGDTHGQNPQIKVWLMSVSSMPSTTLITRAAAWYACWY